MRGPLQLLLSVIYLPQLLRVSVSFAVLGMSDGQKKRSELSLLTNWQIYCLLPIAYSELCPKTDILTSQVKRVKLLSLRY